MKISVIIPIHNSEKTLKASLESVLTQNYSDFDVVAVDNASTDSSKQIIKSFQEKYPQLKYLYESQKSRGAARNAGINVASGEIVCMLDSDCVAPNDWIQLMITPIINDREEIVMGWEDVLEDNFWSRQIQHGNKLFIEHNLKGQYINFVDTKNIAVKKSIFDRYSFDSLMGNLEDYEWSLRARRENKIRFLKEVRVKHFHKTSMISWMKLNYNRAYWAKQIYKKHKDVLDLSTDPLFESFTLNNFLTFPFWMVLQFIRRPITEAFFVLTTEVSWRAGLLFG